MENADEASSPLESTSTNSRSFAGQPGILSCEKPWNREPDFQRARQKIRRIQRALGYGLVPGVSNESGELFVGDRVTVDPEAADSYFMDGTFLRVEFS
jgi:hypothetical protein